MNEIDRIKYIRATEKTKKIKNFYWFMISVIFASVYMVGFAYFLFFNQAEDSFVPITIFLSTPVVMAIVLFMEYMKVFGSVPFFGREWEENKIIEILNEGENSSQWN